RAPTWTGSRSRTGGRSPHRAARAPPRWLAPSGAGSRARFGVHAAQARTVNVSAPVATGLLRFRLLQLGAVQGCRDEVPEERLRAQRTGLELGMELRGDEERVV